MDPERISALVAGRESRIALASSEADFAALLREGDLLAAQVLEWRKKLEREDRELARLASLGRALALASGGRARSASLLNLLG